MRKEIINNLNYMFSLKEERINLFFTEIDQIKEILEKDIKKIIN